jgi:hypothetical protein
MADFIIVSHGRASYGIFSILLQLNGPNHVKRLYND